MLGSRPLSVAEAESQFRAAAAVRASQLARRRRASAEVEQLAYAKKLAALTARLQALPEGSIAAGAARRLESLRVEHEARWAVRRALLERTERNALQRALDAVVRVAPPLPGARRTPAPRPDDGLELPFVVGERIAVGARPPSRASPRSAAHVAAQRARA
jgi:hypothetical protein